MHFACRLSEPDFALHVCLAVKLYQHGSGRSWLWAPTRSAVDESCGIVLLFWSVHPGCEAAVLELKIHGVTCHDHRQASWWPQGACALQIAFNLVLPAMMLTNVASTLSASPDPRLIVLPLAAILQVTPCSGTGICMGLMPASAPFLFPGLHPLLFFAVRRRCS